MYIVTMFTTVLARSHLPYKRVLLGCSTEAVQVDASYRRLASIVYLGGNKLSLFLVFHLAEILFIMSSVQTTHLLNFNCIPITLVLWCRLLAISLDFSTFILLNESLCCSTLTEIHPFVYPTYALLQLPHIFLQMH